VPIKILGYPIEGGTFRKKDEEPVKGYQVRKKERLAKGAAKGAVRGSSLSLNASLSGSLIEKKNREG